MLQVDCRETKTDFLLRQCVKSPNLAVVIRLQKNVALCEHLFLQPLISPHRISKLIIEKRNISEVANRFQADTSGILNQGWAASFFLFYSGWNTDIYGAAHPLEFYPEFAARNQHRTNRHGVREIPFLKVRTAR